MFFSTFCFTGFSWTSTSPQNNDVIYACVNGDIIIPWSYVINGQSEGSEYKKWIFHRGKERRLVRKLQQLYLYPLFVIDKDIIKCIWGYFLLRLQLIGKE